MYMAMVSGKREKLKKTNMKHTVFSGIKQLDYIAKSVTGI